MDLPVYSTRDFADALLALLPPGEAWEWPRGGKGDTLLMGTAEELARVARTPPHTLARAVDMHRPGHTSYHIDFYRQVAMAVIAGVVEPIPRKMLAVGSHVGDRAWSRRGPASTFAIALLQVDPLVGPLRVGSHVGDRAWGSGARNVLRVRYYRGVVDPRPIWEALMAFKQSHIYLWFEDITGHGGEVSYGQN